MTDDKLSRRQFVQLTGSFLIASIGASTLLSLFQGCGKEESNPTQPPTSGASFTIKLSEHPELAQVGGFKTFTINSIPIIVFRTGETTFKALSMICTHQGCTVSWVNSSQQFQCPCHGSKFDKDGKVIQGPATQNLKSYNTEYKSSTNEVIIYL
ncbi:ubiquinol-cytochrome c reductase iron-sulfur subunit [Candidatus Kryptobacter tengchongensis]|uniref:Cytochrome b6-f complex iron-sulfur subunit n=1 Tax=Kryptobacter tengchongensis TaxID=1643429 RepID=A0A916LK04_KRYT1|nr:ubiquinol-cytochrome c reductase iron-sulfur subunit [Candidatus Kryptobacter tengchongensis]CUS99642.1 cytochrome b6-f complex iron-sulfur subunit [Candidatus Kryptobacter tengchongensis]